jgi:hypothetical protein
MSGFMESHTYIISGEGNNVEVNGAAAVTGNGEEGHHDIKNDEEIGAHNDADHYDCEQNVKDVDTEKVPLTSVVRDPHL